MKTTIKIQLLVLVMSILVSACGREELSTQQEPKNRGEVPVQLLPDPPLTPPGR